MEKNQLKIFDSKGYIEAERLEINKWLKISFLFFSFFSSFISFFFLYFPFPFFRENVEKIFYQLLYERKCEFLENRDEETWDDPGNDCY